jgi:hypothetical protein
MAIRPGKIPDFFLETLVHWIEDLNKAFPSGHNNRDDFESLFSKPVALISSPKEVCSREAQ